MIHSLLSPPFKLTSVAFLRNIACKCAERSRCFNNLVDFNLKAFQKKHETEGKQLLFYIKLMPNPSNSPEPKQDPVQDAGRVNEHKS